jgi:hypothetical protein
MANLSSQLKLTVRGVSLPPQLSTENFFKQEPLDINKAY